MPHLSLFLLGPFEARLDGVPITDFESGRARALLAFLAVESDRPQPRETLAGLFWPERPQSSAMSNLRHTLARLRKTVGDLEATPPFFRITRETVAFNPSSDHDLDVQRFAALLGGPTDVERLERAAALYRGPFLEGLTVGDSPAFEEWALAWREHLGQQALVALQRLGEHHEQVGDLDRAESCARRQLALDPLREEAHRQLMRVLALGGERSAALAQYQACCRLLEEELGVEPARETIALYEQIRDGAALASAAEMAANASPTLPAHPPSSGRSAGVAAMAPAPLCVGREEELARLEGALQAAVAGQGRVVFVRGEPGSGKSVLLGELARRAAATHAGMIAIGGACAAYVGLGDPLLPFVQILRLLAGDTDAWPLGGVSAENARRLRALFPLVVQALLDDCPDLIELLPGTVLLKRGRRLSPAPPWRERLEELLRLRATGAGRGNLQPERLFEQYSRLLQAVARQGPLLLLLDDLQWADSGSISLLFHLGRRLAGAKGDGGRMLIVGAYRPEEVAAGREAQRHPLEALLREFRYAWGERGVDLDQADGRRFVEALIDSEPNRLDAAFRETLHRRTGGQALFTVELLREMEQRGDLRRDDEGRWGVGEALDWATLPARVQAAIAERVERLPEELRELLAVASVEGEEFTAEVLAAVQGSDAAAVIRRLSGPLSREQGLVIALGQRRLGEEQVSRYRFRHELFRRYLYDGLDSVRQAYLHGQVGRVLAGLSHSLPRSVVDPAVLADLVRSTWQETGASDMHRQQALEEVSTGVQLARHFRAAGRIDIALPYVVQAARMANQVMAYGPAIEYTHAAIAWLQELPDTVERARLECILQFWASSLSGYDDARVRLPNRLPLMRAYALAQQLGEPDLLALSLFGLSSWHVNCGEWPEALQASERALALVQGHDPTLAALMHERMGFSLHHMGQFAAAHQHHQEALALWARPPGWFVLVPQAVACDILSLWLLGYPDQALQMSRDYAARLADHRYDLAWVRDATCQMHQYRREVQTTREHVEEYRRLAAGAEDRLQSESHAEVLQGWVDALTGRGAEGIAAMRRGIAAWRDFQYSVITPYYLAVLAEGCLCTGRLDEGLSAAVEGLAEVERTGDVRQQAELHRLQGELLQRQGADPEEVESCFRQAIAVAQRQEARSWELRATTSLARLLRDQGRAAKAREMLAAIYGWFTEGWDTADLQEAKALLQELAP